MQLRRERAWLRHMLRGSSRQKVIASHMLPPDVCNLLRRHLAEYKRRYLYL
jgi:hypothetical protein